LEHAEAEASMEMGWSKSMFAAGITERGATSRISSSGKPMGGTLTFRVDLVFLEADVS
jgi:hypothetical protein